MLLSQEERELARAAAERLGMSDDDFVKLAVLMALERFHAEADPILVELRNFLAHHHDPAVAAELALTWREASVLGVLAPTGLTRLRAAVPVDSRARLIAEGLLRPAERPYRRVEPTIRLPADTTSLDLLERDDRL